MFGRFLSALDVVGVTVGDTFLVSNKPKKIGTVSCNHDTRARSWESLLKQLLRRWQGGRMAFVLNVNYAD